MTRSRSYFVAALGVAGLAAGLPAAWAQPPPAPVVPARAAAVAPEARILVEQMVAAHKALTAFSTTIEFVAPTGPAATRTVRSEVAVARPNKVRITSTDAATGAVTQVVSDGVSLFVTTPENKKTYQKTPAGAGSDAVKNAFNAARGASLGLLGVLASGTATVAAVLPGQTQSVTRGPDETVDGTPVDVVSAVVGTGPQQATISFATGKNDHLVRRVTLSGKQGETPFVVTETYLSLKTNPELPAATFVFTPPPGAKMTESEPEPAMYDPRLKVGAAPLPFSGTDLSGKPVTLDQYKGKVVLIDFWATWCGPCVAELPNVVAAYNKYKNKGFDIVGVSLDRAGDRQKLVAFAKSHAMPWRQIYDGKYWQAAQAQRYGVQSIPFTLLIGRDGRIAAVGARGEELEPAIRAALAKK